MARREPPSRRPAVTRELDGYAVTLGYDLETMRVNEVFISGSKVGSEMEGLLQDAAVLLSLALQYGVPHAQLLHSLHHGRADGAESLLGRVVELLHE